jgi:4-amino-4-deoxy-L-arabinose transferase-like glycosyltransferase
MQKRFDYLFPLLFLLVYSITAAALFVSSQAIGDLGVESDFYSELVVGAQKLWNGEFSVENYPFKGPMYSIALVFIHVFGGDWYTNAVVLNLICAMLSLLLIYRLLLRLYNRAVAVAAMLLMSLHFEFFYHAHKASSDMLFFLLVFLAISLMLREKWTWYYPGAAGFISGLAFLTRYNGLIILVAAVVMLIIAYPAEWTRRQRFLAGLIFIGGFLIPCAPWFYMNYVETGQFLTTENLFNIVKEFYGGSKEKDIPAGGFTSVYHLISHDTVYFIGHYVKNIFRYIFLDVRKSLGIYIGVTVFLGILRMFVIPPSRKQLAFLIFAICYYLFMCVVFYIPRLSLPIVPAYLAMGMSLFFGSGHETRTRIGKDLESKFFGRLQWFNHSRRVIIGVLVIVGLIVWELWMVVSAEKFYRGQQPRFLLAAASFLHNSKEPGSTPVIMARKAHIAYYSGMQYQNYPLTWENHAEFIKYALNHDVQYIVYSDIERVHYKVDEFMKRLPENEGVELIYKDIHTQVFSLAEWMNASRIREGMNHTDYVRLMNEAAESRNPNRILYTYKNIAEYHVARGDWQTASKYFLQGLKVIKKLPESEDMLKAMAMTQNYLSQVYLKLKRYRDGIDLMHDNIDLYTGLGDKTGLAQSHMLTFWYYKELEEFDNAWNHMKVARELYVELENRSAIQRIDQLAKQMKNQPALRGKQ